MKMLENQKTASIDRRCALSAAVGAATLFVLYKQSLAQAGGARPIKIPMPADPWPQAEEIVGKGADKDVIYNNFCLTQDRIGRWHCVGIIGGLGIAPGQLFHRVSDQIQGPYKSRPNITVKPSEQSQFEMWAPTIVWSGKNKALMFYAHGIHAKHGDKIDFQMRVLESDKYLDD